MHTALKVNETNVWRSAGRFLKILGRTDDSSKLAEDGNAVVVAVDVCRFGYKFWMLKDVFPWMVSPSERASSLDDFDTWIFPK